jgi:hypothetical protein
LFSIHCKRLDVATHFVAVAVDRHFFNGETIDGERSICIASVSALCHATRKVNGQGRDGLSFERAEACPATNNKKREREREREGEIENESDFFVFRRKQLSDKKGFN